MINESQSRYNIIRHVYRIIVRFEVTLTEISFKTASTAGQQIRKW